MNILFIFLLLTPYNYSPSVVGLETVNEESSGGDKSIAIREKNTENVIGSHIPGDDADGGDNAVEVLGEVVQMRRSLSGGNYPVDLHNSVFAGL